MSIKQILTGHFNELLGRGENLASARMMVCKACPLYKETSFGPQCNATLYLNPETNDTSTLPKEGYTRGCGCRLNAKATLTDAKCPTGKW